MHARPSVTLLALTTLAGCGGATASTAGSAAPVATSGHEASASTHFVEAQVHAAHGAFESAMPIALTSFGGATLRGADGRDAVYVAGGYFGEPHRYSREGQSNALYRYTVSDADGGHWETLAPMDVGAQGLAVVAFGGGLVRCGGSEMRNAADAPTDQHALASCARFDPSTGAWSTFASLPSPRSSFDAAVVGDRIYAVGGWDVQGNVAEARFHSTMAVYANGAWSEVAVPFQRRALAVVGTSRSVVALGGMTSAQELSRSVDVLDVASGAWSSGPEYPGDAFGLAAVAVGDDVYASGRDGVVHRLRSGSTSWERVGSLAEGRFFHRLFARDGNLVAIGGIGSMTTDGRARLVEAMPLAGAAPRVSYVEIDFPGATRNRPGLFVADDSLYVVGGNDSTGQHDFQPENFETAAYRLHLPSLRWYDLPALPAGRQSLVSVVHDGVGIALGGFGHDGNASRTYPDAFVLRSSDETWQALPNALPLPRTQFGLAYQGHALWVFGGLEYDASRPEDQQFVHLASVLRCPVDHEALEAPATSTSPIGACEELTASPMPGTRRAFAGALLDGRYYVMGGMRDGFAPIDDCFVFELASRTWSPMTCPSAVRISADLVPFDGKLYLLGGSSRRDGAQALAPDRTVEVFDPATGTWSVAIDALPFSTHQMRFLVHEERILGFSTQETAGRATVAWIEPR